MAQIKSDSKLCTYTHVQKPVIFPDTSVMNYNLMSWPMVLSSKSIFTSHFKCFLYIMLLLLYKSSNLVDYILDRGFITSIQTEEVGGCEIIHCYAVCAPFSKRTFVIPHFLTGIVPDLHLLCFYSYKILDSAQPLSFHLTSSQSGPPVLFLTLLSTSISIPSISCCTLSSASCF